MSGLLIIYKNNAPKLWGVVFTIKADDVRVLLLKPEGSNNYGKFTLAFL